MYSYSKNKYRFNNILRKIENINFLIFTIQNHHLLFVNIFNFQMMMSKLAISLLLLSSVLAKELFSQANANTNTDALDIRVSKALGSKGYNKIRLSVISNTTISSSLFTYSSQFKYRWTSNYLSTGVVSVTPG